MFKFTKELFKKLIKTILGLHFGIGNNLDFFQKYALFKDFYNIKAFHFFCNISIGNISKFHISQNVAITFTQRCMLY